MLFCRLQSLVFLSSLVLCATSHAAAPAIDYLFPAGGRQGTSVTFTVGGAKADAKLEPWPVSVWSDGDGLKFKAGEKNGQFSVDIAPDCAPGPHLVRFYNADGASAPRLFVVSRHVEQQEPKSKDAPREPHPVAVLPAVLNGQLEKRGETDAWAINVEAGKWIVAELEARRLGSPIDAALQLLDPDGTIVAFGHDEFWLDPMVAYHAPRSGRYILQIAGFVNPPSSDVRFAGSPATVYRLNVTTGPYARRAFPAVVGAVGKAAVRLSGWNLPNDGLAVEVEPRQGQAFAGAEINNHLRIAVSDEQGRLEAEPNDDPPQAITLPAGIDGRLQAPGDVDRYKIAVKKGDRLTLAVRAREIASKLDPVLTVTDADGKQLAREDDTGGVGQDPRLDWQAPADGDYIVAVADLHRAGGPDHIYRLDLTTAPTFSATADASFVVLTPGATAELKLKVVKSGNHSMPLKATVEGLPPGVSAKPVEVAAKGGAVTIKLTAEPTAEPANLAIRVRLSGDVDEKPAVFPTGFDQFAPQTPHLWLTVTGAKEKK